MGKKRRAVVLILMATLCGHVSAQSAVNLCVENGRKVFRSGTCEMQTRADPARVAQGKTLAAGQQGSGQGAVPQKQGKDYDAMSLGDIERGIATTNDAGELWALKAMHRRKMAESGSGGQAVDITCTTTGFGNLAVTNCH